jgi:phospholipase/lecithinase/hemolysin
MRVSPSRTLLAGLLWAAGSAFAMPIGTINQIVAFGDSLSDSGNASIATLGSEPGVRGPGYYYRSVPGVPYQVGEFTNAPVPGGPTGVWVDQLAAKLGVPMAQPSLAGGTNYAVASATTGGATGFDVGSQLNIFKAANSSGAPSNALYTVWAGANDLTPGANPISSADNLYHDILTLSSEGARYFLWANLPNLGKTPDAIQSGPTLAAAATAFSAAFDLEWATDLLKLQKDGIAVAGLDVGALFIQLEANPSTYGLTNVTTPAMSVPGANPNTYLFFDGEHPTTAADALVSDAAFDALTATAAPEPAAIGLAALGLAVLCVAATRARRKLQRN